MNLNTESWFIWGELLIQNVSVFLLPASITSVDWIPQYMSQILALFKCWTVGLETISLIAQDSEWCFFFKWHQRVFDINILNFKIIALSTLRMNIYKNFVADNRINEKKKKPMFMKIDSLLVDIESFKNDLLVFDHWGGEIGWTIVTKKI